MIAAPEQEEDLRAQAMKAFQRIRENAEAQSGPEMTLEEINAEINAVREARQKNV